MKWNFGRMILVGAALGASIGVAPAAMGQMVRSERILSGLSRPLYVTHAPGDFDRIFIVEQRGQPSATQARIRIYNLDTQSLNATAFLTVSGVSTGSEQGLLGLAFHPDYATNGYFFINYTNSVGTTIIARYQVSADPDVANAASATTILSFSQPFSNHNGGWIGFGPEGYLYIATGDGGSANDPSGNAQNINTLLGKMLRINVNSGIPYSSPADNPFAGAIPGRDEIWFYGLRNPWRASFDRMTGDMYIADVGQNAWEEVDWIKSHEQGTMPGDAGYQGGRNFGWRCMEGNACTGLSGCTCNSPALTNPVFVYGHGSSCSVTGGYAYRGCAIPGLQGTYFFADFCSANIWSFRYSQLGGLTEFINRTGQLVPPAGQGLIGSISSFGEDAFGELYICDLGGEVFKILPVGGPSTDCNNNGREDACDILEDPGLDANGNGAIDACEGPFGPIELLNPDDGEPDVALQPMFDWEDVGNTETYRIEVATDVDFVNTVIDVSGLTESQFMPTMDLAADTLHYWRITATNMNGSVISETWSFTTLVPAECPGDLDGDGDIDSTDLNFVLSGFGCTGGGCAGDADGDGDTDSTDLNLVLSTFGEKCP